jgi:hypothetical protein
MDENPYEAPQAAGVEAPTTRRRSRFWAVFFFVLGILGIAFTLTMLIGLAGIAMERDEWAELLVVVGMGCIWIFGSFWLARRMFIRVEVVSGYDE